jgi:phosphoserine phosphatase
MALLRGDSVQEDRRFQGLRLRGLEPPLKLSDYRLIVFDMDSTLVNGESLDELADLAGCREAVAAITRAAMRGEVADYCDSLRSRVALLRGLPEAALQQVYEQRMALNPGAQALVEACKAGGLRCILATSAFTWFTDRLQARLGLDDVRANVLELVDGRVTGRLLPQAWGDICDGEQKKQMLLDTCSRMGISPLQAIAVGDGANDLPMMGVAGLSVGWRPKPVVRDRANVVIEEGGLDRLLEIFTT